MEWASESWKPLESPLATRHGTSWRCNAGIRLYSYAECGGGGDGRAKVDEERGLHRVGRGGARNRNRGGDDHAGSCYADGYKKGRNASIGCNRVLEVGGV